jgi:hypothetical protein
LEDKKMPIKLTSIRRKDGITQRYNVGSDRKVPAPTGTTPSPHQIGSADSGENEILSVHERDVIRRAEQAAVRKATNKQRAILDSKLDAFSAAMIAIRAAEQAEFYAALDPDSEHTAFMVRDAARMLAESEDLHAIATKHDPENFPELFAAHLQGRRQRVQQPAGVLKSELNDIEKSRRPSV